VTSPKKLPKMGRLSEGLLLFGAVLNPSRLASFIEFKEFN
jgi:hypothetical protein